MKNANAIKEKHSKDVRCLCKNCVRDYAYSDKYIVKRLNPLSTVKDNCDKCGRNGWDYLIINRKEYKH